MERIEEEKRIRDQEIRRREAERKKRHEEIARDSKKSFFELNQSDSAPPTDEKSKEATLEETKEEGELDDSHIDNVPKLLTKETEIDLNALDYEVDRDEIVDEQKQNEKHEIVVASTTVEFHSDKTNKLDAKLEKDNRKNTNREDRKDRSGRKVGNRRNRSRSPISKSRSPSRSRNRRKPSPPRRGDRNIDQRKDRESPRRRDRKRNDFYRYQRIDRNRYRSRSRENRRHYSR